MTQSFHSCLDSSGGSVPFLCLCAHRTLPLLSPSEQTILFLCIPFCLQGGACTLVCLWSELWDKGCVVARLFCLVKTALGLHFQKQRAILGYLKGLGVLVKASGHPKHWEDPGLERGACRARGSPKGFFLPEVWSSTLTSLKGFRASQTWN